jgi:hypothetical protein
MSIAFLGNRVLLDMQIGSKEDEWPEEDSKHRRQDLLGATEVGEVVMRVRYDKAQDDIDDEKHLAKQDFPQHEAQHESSSPSVK